MSERGHDDNGGSAARFFYCAKAGRTERDHGVARHGVGALRDGERSAAVARNTHPTVKPLALMRYLLRLTVPPGGIVVDPFGGSGSTAVAAKQLGIRIVIIEREKKYCRIAAQRVAATAYDPAWCATRK